VTAQCKTSFFIDCAKLERVEAFAKAHDMNLSEAFRFVVECGLEALARAGYDVKPLPLGHGATRGVFPAPRSKDDGAEAKQ
jgi:hypothetical protein